MHFGVLFFESRFASSRFLEIKQGYSNLRRLVARATNFLLLFFFTAAPTICGFSVWNLLHAAVLAPGILR
jgi:hypothetical protein